MNQRSDTDRLLRHWMSDGPSTMPDRVLDVVADRIGRTRQRSSWRLRGRLFVNGYTKLAAAAAAIVVVAVVGYNLLPRQPGIGSPSAAPTPTAAPTRTPAPTGPVALTEGVLVGGRYVLQPLPEDPSLSLVADVPTGWNGHPDVPAFTSAGGENVGVLIAWMGPDSLFSDPCKWDLLGTGSDVQPGDVEVGPTVDDLVAALKANTSYTSSVATPFTFDHFAGQQLELQLPGDDVIGTCDRREGQKTGDYFVFPKGFWALGPNNRWQLFIADIGGTRVVNLLSYFPGTPQADVDAGRAIVESFDFTP